MKLLSNDDGVSEVFGYVLIMCIVMTGLGLAILVIMPSMQSTMGNNQVKEVQQGFTVVDSRLSKARFSTSIFQEAPFKLDNGVVSVSDGTGPDSSSNIRVIEHDETTNSDVVPDLYNGPLGTIKCVTDNGEVGYQDGGVFALYDKGLPTERSEMISPPDFDYNGVTLTLPIMHFSKIPLPAGGAVEKIQGGDTASGKDSTMLIDSRSTGPATLVYPTGTLTNPLQNGKTIKIIVTSDYYMAWYEYFKELRLNPTPDKNTRSVTVELSTGHGLQQEPVFNNFNTKYMQTSPATNNKPILAFEFTLVPINGVGADYAAYYQTDTSIYPNLEIEIDAAGGNLNVDYARVVVTYYYGSSNNKKEQWEGLIPYKRKSPSTISVNLLDKTTTAQYDSTNNVYYGVMNYIAPSGSISWGPNWDIDDETTNPGSEATNGGVNSVKSFYDVIEHYTWLMHNKVPDFANGGSKYKVEQRSTGVDPVSSTFTIQYKSDEQIKYLYITEGTLETGVSSKNS